MPLHNPVYSVLCSRSFAIWSQLYTLQRKKCYINVQMSERLGIKWRLRPLNLAFCRYMYMQYFKSYCMEKIFIFSDFELILVILFDDINSILFLRNVTFFLRSIVREIVIGLSYFLQLNFLYQGIPQFRLTFHLGPIYTCIYDTFCGKREFNTLII